MFCASFPIRAYTLVPRTDVENAFDLVPESEGGATDQFSVYCKSAQDYSDFVREFAQLKR